MIEGVPGLDELDLVAQTAVASSTRQVLDALLWHKWFQTELVLAHARLYFDDYAPPTDPPAEGEAARRVSVEPTSVRDYYCFVLLDFASADRELDEAPLAAALVVAEQLELKSRFVSSPDRSYGCGKRSSTKSTNSETPFLPRPSKPSPDSHAASRLSHPVAERRRRSNGRRAGESGAADVAM